MTNKRYWLHRISHEADHSYNLLEEGYLSIGFSDIASESFYETMISDKDTDTKKAALDQAFKDEWGETLNRKRNSLWRFLVEFNVGDTILIPKYKSFDLYQVTSGPLLVSKEIPIYTDVDLGFVLKVEPIHIGISRNDYAPSDLTSRMKIRSMNSDITSLEESIKASITRFVSNNPIDLQRSIVQKQSEDLANVIRKMLNPDKLEELIKWYFEKLGADSVIIPPKNERGKLENADADVIAEFNHLNIIILVQAKHHSGTTNDWSVSQISTYYDQLQANDERDTSISHIPWVISMSDDFSEEAQTIASNRNVRLINGKEFAEMIMNVGIKGMAI